MSPAARAGAGFGFSLEAPEGMRFLTRSRVLTEEEQAALDAAEPPRISRGYPLYSSFM
jgi:hypothetical protein